MTVATEINEHKSNGRIPFIRSLEMSKVQSLLLPAAVICVMASGCLKPEAPAPKYEYGEAAKTEGEQPAGPQPWIPEVAFQNLDENSDGHLALAEYVANRGGGEAMQRGADVFAILDRDGDGQLTLQEFKIKPPEANFREIDLDGDGGLALREFYSGDMPSASIERVTRAFELVDQDDDGSVSLDEFQSRTPEAWFVRVDSSGDGSLSPEEYGDANQNLVRNNRLDVVFGAMDRDGNGNLSLEEFTNKPPEVSFLKRDMDGDDKLSLHEFSVWSRTPEQRSADKVSFVNKDVDGDGSMTLEEYLMPAEEARFRKLDVDRDGALSQEEFAADGRNLGDQAKAQELFSAKDADRNGALTLREFKSRSLKVIFLENDLDGDGGLSLQEFQRADMHWATIERAQKAFEAVDRDDDQRVSFEELRGRPSEAWFFRSDFDGDDRISLKEYGDVNPSLVRSGRHQIVFVAMDRNGDGALSLDEFPEGRSQEATFLKQDKDADNKLSFEEYSVWSHTPEQIAAAQKAFQSRDADGDGLLSFRESAYTPADADFWAMDQDRDDRVTIEEFTPAATPTGDAEVATETPAVPQAPEEAKPAGASEPGDPWEELFRSIDTSGDGAIRLDEFKRQPGELRFQRLDVNQDRLLTLEELKVLRTTPDETAEAEKTFKAKDANGDGSLTLAEYAGGN